MKITGWDDENIYFSDGSKITYTHEQDCCEVNYADFSVLDIFYDKENPVEFESYNIKAVDEGFLLYLNGDPLSKQFDILFLCTELIFSTAKAKIFIPCYSEQNGYYSSSVNIIVNDAKGNVVDRDLVDCEEIIR